MNALGGPFDQLTSPGRDRPKVPNYAGMEAVLSRLRGEDIVSQMCPPGHIRATFTPKWFQDGVEAPIVSVVGIPTLMLTLTAFNENDRLRTVVSHGVLELIAVTGTLGLAAYGWFSRRPSIEGVTVLHMTVPTFLLLLMNLAGVVVAVVWP
jgi:hypothetical protein